MGLVLLLAVFHEVGIFTLTPAATVKVGYDTEAQCMAAKLWYQQGGCTCPSDEFDCTWTGPPPDQGGWVIHCDHCPSVIPGGHYAPGRCRSEITMCVQAASLGVIPSCDGDWHCENNACQCSEYEPFCGDGICDNSIESFYNCPQDCKDNRDTLTKLIDMIKDFFRWVFERFS
jgi:hypothetical protein